MENVYDRIRKDISTAMTDGNFVRRDCLRGVVSEIKNRTVNEGKDITDKVCLDVLRKSSKQRNDSIESFKSGGREDLALREMEELSYIESYLPKESTEEETRQIIDAILETVECVKKNFGTIMRMLPEEVNRKVASAILNGILK